MNYNAEAIRMAVDQIAEREDELEKMLFLRNEIPSWRPFTGGGGWG